MDSFVVREYHKRTKTCLEIIEKHGITPPECASMPKKTGSVVLRPFPIPTLTVPHPYDFGVASLRTMVFVKSLQNLKVPGFDFLSREWVRRELLGRIETT